MVVCKCRKSTRLYCFVHKVPVCSLCICFQQHHLCVVRTYSEWVVDGDYDWPPHCGFCQQSLLGAEADAIRLGCLHVLHGACLQTLLTSAQDHACPSCSSPIWPPKNFRDLSSGLPLRLRNAMHQTATESSAEEIPQQSVDIPPETRIPESLLSETPDISSSIVGNRSVHEQHHPPNTVLDENESKYRRRGPLHRQIATRLLPVWDSSRAFALPLTADDCRQLSRMSKSGTRKILLSLAILSCIATVIMLYQIIER